ncbi:MAG: hypothetical protein VKK04_10550 [Synechococcales bacterium]|nr:hypothetical protein [Synechococcales bacterium]
MHQQLTQLFHALARAGAIPGEDFSVDTCGGSLRMNERSYQLLKQCYPEIDWDDITASVECQPDNAARAINRHLGTDFVGRILKSIQARLSALPRERAAWYLQQVVVGVQIRTGLSLYDLLMQTLPPARCVYVEYLLREGIAPEPCPEWVQDLVLAAGGTADDITLDGEDVYLSERGMWLLAEIWMGEQDLYAELVEASRH